MTVIKPNIQQSASDVQCSTFGRAGGETLHDAPLKNPHQQNQWDGAHDNSGGDRTPWRLVEGGTAECCDAGGNRFHPVVRHEGEREQKFIPSEDEDEDGRGSERRCG